jgi:hypothetical protein
MQNVPISPYPTIAFLLSFPQSFHENRSLFLLIFPSVPCNLLAPAAYNAHHQQTHTNPVSRKQSTYLLPRPLRRLHKSTRNLIPHHHLPLLLPPPRPCPHCGTQSPFLTPVTQGGVEIAEIQQSRERAPSPPKRKDPTASFAVPPRTRKRKDRIDSKGGGN